MNKIVYVVHAVDTEGPLYESQLATFERLKDTFGIVLEPSYSNIQKLLNKELDLQGKEDIVAKFVDPTLLTYNDTWDKIEKMLKVIMNKAYRQALPDSFGGGWIYNWHCLDHVMFETNPRRRDMGYHNIHDKYLEFLDKYNSQMDFIEWHFHPMSTYKEAHRCASSFENSPHLHQILCRRIIERNFFPAVFRAGFQTERPDSNWFLEQWIPFDCSSIAIDNYADFELQNDFKNGRSGDWRGAPADWSIYHPDLYDYRKKGSLNRYIARFLNINTRIANIDQAEVDKAFEKANGGEHVLMGVTNHDFRDMQSEIDFVRELVNNASQKFPEVKFKYAGAREAFNQVVHEGRTEDIKLDVELYQEDGYYKLRVYTKQSEVFGPQPYLAIETKSGRFIHDNFDFGMDGKSWFYVFDFDTVHSDDLKHVGVAANNKYGDTFIKTIKVD